MANIDPDALRRFIREAVKEITFTWESPSMDVFEVGTFDPETVKYEVKRTMTGVLLVELDMPPLYAYEHVDEREVFVEALVAKIRELEQKSE